MDVTSLMCWLPFVVIDCNFGLSFGLAWRMFCTVWYHVNFTVMYFVFWDFYVYIIWIYRCGNKSMPIITGSKQYYKCTYANAQQYTLFAKHLLYLSPESITVATHIRCRHKNNPKSSWLTISHVESQLSYLFSYCG